MTRQMRDNFGLLMQTVQEFEAAAGVTVVVQCKTNGEVKLLVKDDHSEMKKTMTFGTPLQAVEHIRETALLEE